MKENKMDLQGTTFEALDRLCTRGRSRGIHITSTVTVDPVGRVSDPQTTVSVDPSKALRSMSEADSRDVETLARSGRTVGVRVTYMSQAA